MVSRVLSQCGGYGSIAALLLRVIMARLFYSILWYLLLPLLFARLWWRGRRAPAYRRRWAERLGFYGVKPLPGCVWVHAVSVGETLAAAPMIEALLKKYPHMPLLITTTTPTGSERVQALFGKRVHHVYAPWELPGAVARLFNHFNPHLVLLLETELWPNIVATAHKRDVPVMLINGRLSARSAKGYGKLPALVRPMLQAFTTLAVQTRADAERFEALGASPKQLVVTGSVKFDIAVSDAQRAAARHWRAQVARPVWIAASTHPGEDELVLAAHRQILARTPQALLLLVPRHPERFDSVAALIQATGFTLARRSQLATPAADTQVYLCDSMGELMQLFGFADVAFVGGSLVDVGGHNLLEPSAWSLPVLSGPYVHNFEAIAALLTDAGGLVTVNDTDQLGRSVGLLLGNAAQCRKHGEAANAVLTAHQGALQRVLSLVSAAWPSVL